MHDAGNPVKSRFFFLPDVSVPFEDDDVSFSLDDSVKKDIAFDVAYEGYCSGADVAVSPWPQGDLIPQMKESGVHAVAFGSEGHSMSFSNEFADFRKNDLFILINLL